MEIPDLALTKTRCTKPRLKASASEVCHALVIRSFRRISLMFTSFVKKRLRCVYGQPSWLTTAKACLGPRMRSYCREDSDWDVYTVCEVLLDQLDGVFLSQAENIDRVVGDGALIEQVAREVDTVCQSRNWMFHNEGLSPRESLRCLLAAKKLIGRFSSHFMPGGGSMLEDDLKVGWKLSLNIFGRSFFAFF